MVKEHKINARNIFAFSPRHGWRKRYGYSGKLRRTAHLNDTESLKQCDDPLSARYALFAFPGPKLLEIRCDFRCFHPKTVGLPDMVP